MEIESLKDRVVEACQMIGGGLPYDAESIEADDWDSLADYLADVARHVCVGGNRMAGYAGYARRRANEDAG